MILSDTFLVAGKCSGLSGFMDEFNIESGLKLIVRIEKLIFLFLNQNICCGYSKHPKHMLKLMGKNYLKFYAQKFCLSKPGLSFAIGSENHKCFIHIMIFQ